MAVKMFGSRCNSWKQSEGFSILLVDGATSVDQHVYTCTHTDIFEDVTGFLYNTNVHVSLTHGNSINGLWFM